MSARAEMDQIIPLQLSLQLFGHLKARATTNKIKCEPVQMAAADLLPSESHSAANVSLQARLQKLSTATLIITGQQWHQVAP